MAKTQATKKTEPVEIVSINGLSIRENSIYQVIDKYDASAPLGLDGERTSKLPSVGISELIGCNYVLIKGDVNGRGVYDTGFFENSPRYAGMEQSKVKSIVKSLQSHIVNPYEKQVGSPGLLDNGNIAFWSEYVVSLEKGRVFNTAIPSDLLDLYIAVASYRLAPKSMENNPSFNKAQFCVEDTRSIVSAKAEQADLTFKAYATFANISQTDKDNLVYLLRYVGAVTNPNKYELGELMVSFQNWINTYENVKSFERACAIYEDENRRGVFKMYDRLYNALRKGMLSQKGASFLYNGESLGTDLKMIAEDLIVNPNLADTVAAFILATDKFYDK